MISNLNGVGIHLEITSNCNSRCLDCGRYVKGTDIVNPKIDIGSSGNFSVNKIYNIFDNIICDTARYINFTGTYGEATMHPYFFDILNIISELISNRKQQRQRNGLSTNLVLMIETNGGLHTNNWWKEFAEIIKNKFDNDSRVIFGIDGIDDETHQLYRRGVNYNSVIDHSKEVIKAGVKAIWSMISFSHNEHQISKAKKIAAELGFFKFKIRRSRLRSIVNDTVPTLNNVLTKKSEISKEKILHSKNYSEIFSNKVDDNKKNKKFYFEKQVDSYFDKTSIICEWKEKNQISIDYTGRVWQCCYFSTFYHMPIEYDQLGKINFDYNLESRRFENLDYYEKQYVENWNNVNYNKLSSIMTHNFFVNDLKDSFNHSTSSLNMPRILRCAKHCGEKSRKIEEKITHINKEY